MTFTLKKERKFGFRFLVVFLVSYLGIVFLTIGYDYYLDMNLASYDINGDGIFSSDESSIEQQEAMKKVIGDAGRNFIIFTSFIYGLLSAIIFMILRFIFLRFNFIRNRNV